MVFHLGQQFFATWQFLLVKNVWLEKEQGYNHIIVVVKISAIPALSPKWGNYYLSLIAMCCWGLGSCCTTTYNKVFLKCY